MYLFIRIGPENIQTMHVSQNELEIEFIQ